MSYFNTGEKFQDRSGGKLQSEKERRLTAVAYMDLNDVVADSINADWGHVRHANKTLSRLADINESTLKGIRQRKHTPSLKTAVQLAPHTPTLRQRLAEILGVDTSASSEAKRIHLAMKILAGESHVQELSNRLPQMEGIQH